MTQGERESLWVRLGASAWVRCEACGTTLKLAHGEPFACKNCTNEPESVYCGSTSRMVQLPNELPTWSTWL